MDKLFIITINDIVGLILLFGLILFGLFWWLRDLVLEKACKHKSYNIILKPNGIKRAVCNKCKKDIGQVIE